MIMTSLWISYIFVFLLSVHHTFSKRTSIGVIDGIHHADNPQTIRVRDRGDDDRETVLHWKYTDTTETYKVMKQVVDFQDVHVDWIVINDSRSDIWRIFSDGTNFNFNIYQANNNTLNKIGIDFSKQDRLSSPEKNNDSGYFTSKVYLYNLLNSVMELFATLQMSSVVIIYEDETAFIAEHLKVTLSRKGMFAMTYPENVITGLNANTTNSSLHYIYETFEERGINVTVICRVDCVQRVMNKANMYDHEAINKHQTSMRLKSRWLILTRTNDMDGDIADYAYDLDNVAVINMKTSCSLVDKQSCPSLLDTQSLIDSSLQSDFSLGGVNVTLSSSTFNYVHQELHDQSNTVPVCLRCPIASLYWTKHGAKIRTLLDSKGKRHFGTVGYFNVSGGFQIQQDLFPNADLGFNAREFLVTTNWWPPFMDRKKINGTLQYFGFCQDLLEELAREMNFTYRMTEPLDKEWGYALANGSWTGMIGQLQNEEVDMMIAPASIQAGREMVMDFTHPYYFDTSTILMQKPDVNRTKWKTLIQPFQDKVHLCIWIVLPVAAFFLFLFERCNPYYKGSDSLDQRTYQSAFWYMFGAMLTQGGDRTPESQSGRTLISFWWIFSIVMVATYSGNLIAFLTVTKEKLPFNSLQEMVQQNQYQWGTLSGTYFITMFKDSTLEVYQKVWSGIVKANATDPRALSPDPAVHIQKILSEDYVYFGDKVVMDMRRVNDCRLITAEEEIPNMSYGVGLPNHSPYTKLFSNKILTLLESGIFHIYEQRHWPKINFCKGSLTTEATPIAMIDVQSAFYLIGIGIGIGLLTLSGEVICRYGRRCLFCRSSSVNKDDKQS